MINLHLGDCMEAMPLMPDKCFDLAIVDPPYGIGQDGGTCRSKFVKQKNGSRIFCEDGKYQKKNWDQIPTGPEYFIELERVSINRIIWGMNYHPYLLRGGCIVWDKVKDKSNYSKAEIAFCSLHDSIQIFRFMWNGMMQGGPDGNTQQGNKRLNERRIHPTQKPVALYRWLLDNYAKPGDRILDTHGGSMSIAIACHDLGYDLELYEIDLDYFTAGKGRLRRHQAQGRLF